jgi:hypothetical protein
MQTFLPYPDLEESIVCLDSKRLGKQRVEAMQILNILTGKQKTKGWINHPAVLMWKGFENALRYYMNLAIVWWILRGYNNTMLMQPINESSVELPTWFGNPEFHDSHKSNLLRKDESFYKQYNWQVKPDLSYYWPVKR